MTLTEADYDTNLMEAWCHYRETSYPQKATFITTLLFVCNFIPSYLYNPISQPELTPFS
jgi:hypothetical protein